jgi:hypothetical protein
MYIRVDYTAYFTLFVISSPHIHAGHVGSGTQEGGQAIWQPSSQDRLRVTFIMILQRLHHPEGTFQVFSNGYVNDFTNGKVTDRNFEDLFTSDPRLEGQASNWQKGLTDEQVNRVRNNLHLFKSRWRPRFINPPPKPTKHPGILARARMHKPDDDEDANSYMSTSVQMAK